MAFNLWPTKILRELWPKKVVNHYYKVITAIEKKKEDVILVEKLNSVNWPLYLLIHRWFKIDGSFSKIIPQF